MGFCWEKQKDFNRARYYYRQASKLNPKDDSIFYKIGETYTREKQWESAIKAYSIALQLDNTNASYCMAIGNCLMELDVKNEALVCFVNAVRLKPGNKSTWMALIKGLYLSGSYDEALIQIEGARDRCGDKGDFRYLQSMALFAKGKTKEALIQLETALRLAPRGIKMLTDLDPELMRRQAVTDLVAKYKKK